MQRSDAVDPVTVAAVHDAAENASVDLPPALPRRLARIGLWIGGFALLVFVLDLLGVPAREWIRELFDQIADIPAWAIVAGGSLQTAQTCFAALAWLGILRAALPNATIPFRLVLACYAVAVALNAFLPANIGTVVMLVMFSTLIAGATFAMAASGILVQKIPFTVLNVALYLYLFLSVGGSFSVKLGFVTEHVALLILTAIGATILVVMLVRIFWEKLEKLRAQLVTGGAILRSPRRTVFDLVLPVFGSYLARLAIVGVFLGAYGIPVTFHNIATVTASNSISNSVSATPGGVGVTQALNATALSGETSASTATAYSISQQLFTSAWNVLFAIILVSWVFGWSGGKALVRSSYEDAKVKSRGLRSSHERNKEKSPTT